MNRRRLIGVLALLSVLAAGVWGVQRGLNRPRDPAPVAQVVNLTLAQRQAALLAFGPRPVGTPGHDRAVDWLAAQLRGLGYLTTSQPVQVERTFDLGGLVQVGGLRVPAGALPGSGGGDQTGRLIRIPPDGGQAALNRLDLSTNIAITTAQCRHALPALTDAVLRAGAFGLVVLDACPERAYSPVEATPLPLLRLSVAAGTPLLARAGAQVRVVSKVETRVVQGRTLIAHRAQAQPEVLYGAHLDSVPGSVGAGRNASGVLGVLDLARQARGIPLSERAWFVLFDAGEDGQLGSAEFVREHRYALRQTRAMLNLDQIGVAAQPLGVSGQADLIGMARRLRPGLRVFDDRGPFDRRVPNLGRGDQVAFIRWDVRTLLLTRGRHAQDRRPGDRQADPALIGDAADLALQVGLAALRAPYTAPVGNLGAK